MHFLDFSSDPLILTVSQDSPLGVHFSDFITPFPSGINAAASFNKGLIRTRGLLMGREHHGKGPLMNIGQVAQGGRNWEGFGAEAAYETIWGCNRLALWLVLNILSVSQCGFPLLQSIWSSLMSVL